MEMELKIFELINKLYLTNDLNEIELEYIYLELKLISVREPFSFFESDLSESSFDHSCL